MAEEREFSVEARAGYTLLRVESCRLDALLSPRFKIRIRVAERAGGYHGSA